MNGASNAAVVEPSEPSPTLSMRRRPACSPRPSARSLRPDASRSLAHWRRHVGVMRSASRPALHARSKTDSSDVPSVDAVRPARDVSSGVGGVVEACRPGAPCDTSLACPSEPCRPASASRTFRRPHGAVRRRRPRLRPRSGQRHVPIRRLIQTDDRASPRRFKSRRGSSPPTRVIHRRR